MMPALNFNVKQCQASLSLPQFVFHGGSVPRHLSLKDTGITVTAGGMAKLGGRRTGVLHGQKWIC